MMEPYYADDLVTLYLGDCREVTGWLAADVLVTDPPYGRGTNQSGGTRRQKPEYQAFAIANDKDTGVRDAALTAWGNRPAVVFGDLMLAPPHGSKQVLIHEKAPDSGWRSTLGFRRNAEAVYLLNLPCKYGGRSCILRSGNRGQSHLVTRSGHTHAKPVDVMETLIAACPPGVIADPFVGSGSTLVAARNLGRKAIGVEVDERYCETAARRLSQGVLVPSA